MTCFNVSSRFFLCSHVTFVCAVRSLKLTLFSLVGFHRFKTLDFCAPTVLRLIRKRKSVPTGETLTVKPPLCTTEATILTFTESDQISKAKSQALLKTTKFFICSMPKQVCTISKNFMFPAMICWFSYLPGDARRSKQYIVNQEKQNTPKTTTTTRAPTTRITTTTTTHRPTYEQTTRIVASTYRPAHQPNHFNDNVAASTYRPAHNFFINPKVSQGSGKLNCTAETQKWDPLSDRWRDLEAVAEFQLLQ